MLRELHIQNMAIIEQVDIELACGLNVFTGQTGAGKSLILGSLELLLGLRGGGEEAALFVRPGCSEARVSGVFELASQQTAQRLAAILDQPIIMAEPILVTRRLAATGRSSVSVNGSPVTAGMLREAGQLLVDIHGQHDQQVLLRPANQLAILDAFADAEEARQEFAGVFRQLRDSQRRLAELRQSEEKRVELLDLYRFQLEEIDKAAPREGEFTDARNRYSVLKNIAHLKANAASAIAALSDGDDTVLDRVGSLKRLLGELAKMDVSMAETASQVDQSEVILQEAARELGRYQDRLDVDGDELQQVEQRLDTLNRLIHKYARSAAPADDPVSAVLAHRQQLAEKISQLEQDCQVLGTLDQDIAALQTQLGQVGQKLTRLRTQAARRLKTLVEEQFRDLEMHEATFDIDIRTRPANDAAIDSTGLDEMEFLVRTNPGQERLPLRKIASGGEISRIMLAMKTILADKDQVSVLVFDEIDANIGDRLGATIGRKMRALAHGQRPPEKNASRRAKGGSNGNGHQIICITHLSQIAACGDHHLQISKQAVGGAKDRQTVAKVRVLEGEDRVRELAEMMAGKNATAATLTHARNLLAQG